MNRADLERLDREGLIERAETAGVTRPRILTRPELVDELLLRGAGEHAAKQRARGLFGVARDLLARVVERGLHLPDAADRIRTLGAPMPSRYGAPAALPTVTLAEIYAAQGHRERALETLERVLAREPDHAAAQALLAQLTDATFPLPPPRMPPEPEEVTLAEPPAPSAAPESDLPENDLLANDAQQKDGGAVEGSHPPQLVEEGLLPTRHDVDECVAIRIDSETLYVYWELREQTLQDVRAVREGKITLRLVVVVPTWDGPRANTRDVELATMIGESFVHDLPPRSVVRAAVGWAHAAAFVPLAHSPALEASAGAPSPLVADTLERWTPQGARALAADDRDAAAIARALGRARHEAARAWRIGSLAERNGLTGERVT